jgi:hypothetical protein
MQLVCETSFGVPQTQGRGKRSSLCMPPARKMCRRGAQGFPVMRRKQFGLHHQSIPQASSVPRILTGVPRSLARTRQSLQGQAHKREKFPKVLRSWSVNGIKSAGIRIQHLARIGHPGQRRTFLILL